jgi:hypothetical protein
MAEDRKQTGEAVDDPQVLDAEQRAEAPARGMTA